jgi:hypothetical protein
MATHGTAIAAGGGTEEEVSEPTLEAGPSAVERIGMGRFETVHAVVANLFENRQNVDAAVKCIVSINIEEEAYRVPALN